MLVLRKSNIKFFLKKIDVVDITSSVSNVNIESNISITTQ